MVKNNDLVADFRFLVEKKQFINRCIMAFDIEELKKVRSAAIKLDIPDWESKATVDVMFEIAGRLSILELNIVSPSSLMDAIDKFLESN